MLPCSGEARRSDKQEQTGPCGFIQNTDNSLLSLRSPFRAVFCWNSARGWKQQLHLLSTRIWLSPEHAARQRSEGHPGHISHTSSCESSAEMKTSHLMLHLPRPSEAPVSVWLQGFHTRKEKTIPIFNTCWNYPPLLSTWPAEQNNRQPRLAAGVSFAQCTHSWMPSTDSKDPPSRNTQPKTC